jgi:hypothetical protein
MHYIFQRRLNMLDVVINDLKDEELGDPGLEKKLQEEHRIEIPEVVYDKVKYDVKKERLTSETAPAGFHIRHGQEYNYMTATFSFSDDQFITDLLTLQNSDEGLLLAGKEVVYTEYSHDPIAKDSPEFERIKDNAKRAMATVELCLDEAAADAAEFNQVYLPAAIDQKLAAERARRLVAAQAKALKESYAKAE